MPDVSFIGLPALLARQRAAAMAGVKASMETLENAARDEIPVLSGTLRGTLDTEGPVAAGPLVAGKVKAGEGLDYAVIVHEKHPNSGTKFLTRPMVAHMPVHRALLSAASRKLF